MLGYSQSAQFAGQVIGPLMGGFLGAHVGIRSVFLATSALMAVRRRSDVDGAQHPVRARRDETTVGS